MESFFQNHAYLVEHTHMPIRRSLMDTIDWSYRMIGICGPRGVGKTSFLLQYAKENFDMHGRYCLYINMNNFYFQGRGLIEFANDFTSKGGGVLIIDQAYKLPHWQHQLFECYKQFPHLHIIYSTTTVLYPIETEESKLLNQITKTYILHGFSFREYVNLKTGKNFESISLDDIINKHDQVQRFILQKVRPWHYMRDYLYHGYYPFFLENRNFTENLLKSINMMLEIDVLFIKQIELKYLSRLKKLLYLLAVDGAISPNISRLAEDIHTSRATVMNYLKNLEEARLIRLVYREGESFPKKPALVMMHNTNLMYAVYSKDTTDQQVNETFFANSIWRHHKVNKGRRNGFYTIDEDLKICICEKSKRIKTKENNVLYARYNAEVGRGNNIPMWLFGFLQ